VDSRTVLALFVNKMDLADQSVLANPRAFAVKKRLLFFPVSAKTGEGIEEAFVLIARKAMHVVSFPNSLECLLVGDRCVGKTSLVSCFFLEPFSDVYQPTEYLLQRCENISVGGGSVPLHTRDVSGSEGPESLRDEWYQPTVVILVYDMTNLATYAHIQRWISALRALRNLKESDVWTFIVGNKADLVEEPVLVSSSRRSAENTPLQFFNVSAKTGLNIAELRQAVMETLSRPRVKGEDQKRKASPRKK
jgi:GTPase SAR1 family protein